MWILFHEGKLVEDSRYSRWPNINSKKRDEYTLESTAEIKFGSFPAII